MSSKLEIRVGRLGYGYINKKVQLENIVLTYRLSDVMNAIEKLTYGTYSKRVNQCYNIKNYAVIIL